MRIFELKHDGFRALARSGARATVALGGRSMTDQFPEIAASLPRLPEPCSMASLSFLWLIELQECVQRVAQCIRDAVDCLKSNHGLRGATVLTHLLHENAVPTNC